MVLPTGGLLPTAVKASHTSLRWILLIFALAGGVMTAGPTSGPPANHMCLRVVALSGN